MTHTTQNITPAAALVLASLVDHKGEWMNAEWETETKPAAKHKGVTLTKRCTAVVRTGVAFANLGVVKDAIEAGERGEVGSLPSWQEWAAFPFILRHKTKGTEYVRLTLAGSDRISVRLFVNGTEVDRETFNGYLTPSDAKGGEKPEVISVKLENIRRLG